MLILIFNNYKFQVWNTFHSFNKVEEAIRQSLKNLGLDYLDLYLIHWPLGYQVILFLRFNLKFQLICHLFENKLGEHCGLSKRR